MADQLQPNQSPRRKTDARRGGTGDTSASSDDLLARAEAMLSEGSISADEPNRPSSPISSRRRKVVRNKPQPQGPIDIKQVIASGTRKASLDQLAKEGHRHVRVINESKINELILHAVMKVIEKRGQDSKLSEEEAAARAELEAIDAEIEKIRARLADDDLSPEEKEQLLERLAELQRNRAIQKQLIDKQTKKIVSDSRDEFKLLLEKQKAEAQKMTALEQKVELFEKERSELKDELAALREKHAEASAKAGLVDEEELKELRRARDRSDEDTRKARGQVDKVRELWESAKIEQNHELERLQAEAERARVEAEASRTSGKAFQDDLEKLHTDADRYRGEAEELRIEFEKSQAKLEMQGEQMETLTAENQELRTAAPAAAAQDAEAVQLMEQLQSALTAQGEGVSGSLKSQLSDMQGALKEEIQRQMASATASAKVGGKVVDTSTYLDSLFRDDMQMETNINAVKERKTSTKGKSKLSDSLKKLKKMQGGGDGG